MVDDEKLPDPLQSPLALKQSARRTSQERIYESVQRGGGEPFGRPFDLGLATLTEKIVAVFQQKGFFAFESLDRPGQTKSVSTRRRNIFTRYAAARFRGPLKKKAVVSSPSDASTPHKK